MTWKWVGKGSGRVRGRWLSNAQLPNAPPRYLTHVCLHSNRGLHNKPGASFQRKSNRAPITNQDFVCLLWGTAYTLAIPLLYLSDNYINLLCEWLFEPIGEIRRFSQREFWIHAPYCQSIQHNIQHVKFFFKKMCPCGKPSKYYTSRVLYISLPSLYSSIFSIKTPQRWVFSTTIIYRWSSSSARGVGECNVVDWVLL